MFRMIMTVLQCVQYETVITFLECVQYELVFKHPSRQVEVCTIFLHTEEHDENHLDGFPRSGLKSSEV